MTPSKRRKMQAPAKTEEKDLKVGQGFNDSRGEIPDQEDIPSHNGQNVNNDPSHRRGKAFSSDDQANRH